MEKGTFSDLTMPNKDLEPKGQLYHVGARFKVLFFGVLMAASDLSCISFQNPNHWI